MGLRSAREIGPCQTDLGSDLPGAGETRDDAQASGVVFGCGYVRPGTMQAGGSLPSVNRLLAEPESGIFHSMIVCPNAPQLTVEDYRSLPEAGPRYQLIGGDLYMAPAPNRFHQEISRNLQVKLFLYLRATGAGKIFNSPFDVYLDETNVFQPDLIVVLNDRLGILTEAGAEGAPNLVIEILSPKTRRLDLEQKRKAYPRFGVQELWIIDPDPRLTTQHRFCADGSVITVAISESDSLSSPLLPGFVISGTELYER